MKICEKIEKHGIELIIIKGNHDQFYKNLPTPHSLSFMSRFNCITIVDTEPYYLDNHNILVPWGYDISQLPEKTNLYGHFEINGFITNSSGRTQEGSILNKSHFKKFNTVYSGHFHTPSKDKNIQYIGSVYPMDFNDINSPRGYYILSESEIGFIEFTKAPSFERMDAGDVESIDKNKICGNIVNLVFTKDYGNYNNDEIIRKVQELEPLELHTDFKIETEDSSLDRKESLELTNNSEVFREYIDDTNDIPNHINRDILKKFVGQLEGDI